jgi:hypothetical protein
MIILVPVVFVALQGMSIYLMFVRKHELPCVQRAYAIHGVVCMWSSFTIASGSIFPTSSLPHMLEFTLACPLYVAEITTYFDFPIQTIIALSFASLSFVLCGLLSIAVDDLVYKYTLAGIGTVYYVLCMMFIGLKIKDRRKEQRVPWLIFVLILVTWPMYTLNFFLGPEISQCIDRFTEHKVNLGTTVFLKSATTYLLTTA